MRENEDIDFGTLFRTYYEPLYYFALQYVPDEDDCRDIVAGVFEQLWRNIADIRPDTVRALLYTHVRNRCIDLLRHEKQKHQYAEFVARHSQRYIEARIVTEVLDSIGEPTHSILLACYVDGKKYKEVAERMNISISTVKKHIVKALRIIREKRKERETKKS